MVFVPLSSADFGIIHCSLQIRILSLLSKSVTLGINFFSSARYLLFATYLITIYIAAYFVI